MHLTLKASVKHFKHHISHSLFPITKEAFGNQPGGLVERFSHYKIKIICSKTQKNY